MGANKVWSILTVSRLAVAAGAALLLVTAYGLWSPNDQRDALGVARDYRQALLALDASFARHGSSPAFLDESTRIYASAIDYSWPPELTRVPLKDNWLLHLLGYLDRLLVELGLTDVENLFSEFQSLKYERGFRRGFGICSQNAIAMTDLLARRYDIDAYVISLGGHVVVEAVLDSGRTLHDPSLGVSFPLGLEEIEASPVEPIEQAYAAVGYPELAATYDRQNNVRNPLGARGYRPKIFVVERAFDWLRWLIPIALVVLGVIGIRRVRAATPAE